MRARSIALSLTALSLSACGGTETTGPAAASLCATRQGLEICVNRSEIRQGASIRVTVRNTTAAPIFKDGCATKAVGRTSRQVEYEEIYNASVRCGAGAGPAEIVAAMTELAPGQTFEELVEIPFFAFQGFYRINVWVLESDGSLASPTPSYSGEFEVFRTAD